MKPVASKVQENVFGIFMKEIYAQFRRVDMGPNFLFVGLFLRIFIATTFDLRGLCRMTFRPTSLERAFQLARTGEFPGLGGVLDRLRAEGFEAHQVEGPILKRQLRDLCAAAHAQRAKDE